MSEKKQPILNIFDVLGQIDMRNKNFYDNLSEEEQKGFISYVILQWLSTVQDSSGYSAYYVLLVNEMLNVNFWEISKHNSLVYKLMSNIGIGKKLRHEWIPISKKNKTKHFGDFIDRIYPNIKDYEYQMILSKLTPEMIKEKARDMALSDEEIKKILSDFKTIK